MAETSMDYSSVESMASTFGSTGDVLEGVRVALQATIMALSSNFFTGLAGAGVIVYLQNIVNKMGPVIDMCNEFQGDLNGAVRSLRDGDQTASTRFV